MVEGRAVYAVFPDFSKALDTVPLIAKLMKYGLNEQIVRRVGNLLNN